MIHRHIILNFGKVLQPKCNIKFWILLEPNVTQFFFIGHDNPDTAAVCPSRSGLRISITLVVSLNKQKLLHNTKQSLDKHMPNKRGQPHLLLPSGEI